jgi:hypothetical protein
MLPFFDAYARGLHAGSRLVGATQNAASSLLRYQNDFFIPYVLSSLYFQRAEAQKLGTMPIDETLKAFFDLGKINLDMIQHGVSGVIDAAGKLGDINLADITEAFAKTYNGDLQALTAMIQRQADLMELIAQGYPQAINAIEAEFGFHFERGQHTLVDETDRFWLYRIKPTNGAEIRFDRKPICILPPYVLGANILGFLPGEERSYAHCFANQGIPTYIRILKDIATSAPLQLMSGEDDARDTRRFCETIREAHAKPVTLNGYCQGGYSALCNLLSGELDGLVDAFITCVAPMDGTRSKGLASFLNRLPERFNDLAYGTKTLINGNQVADGRLMGWVYKLKSIDTESPLAAWLRDLQMLTRTAGDATKISSTAAALNYWLAYERNDLPLEITKMSFASFNTPITEDGTLPVRLFGKPLNLKRITAKKIPWLICYGIHDDLVEKEAALAPLDFVAAEVTPFPKGHVAIATSWSHPASACALHTRFGEEQYRGPVRFQLDLDADLDGKPAAKKRPPKKRRPRSA